MRASSALVAILALALPGLMLAPAWRIGGLGAGEDDILYYFPSRVWFHELAQAGQPPWLNPWNGLDRPLLADPQAAVTYPPTWLFAVMLPENAYPLSLWLHYSLAFWGMYRLLRAQGMRRPAALFGATAFAFCGFLLAHRAHFTMQHAAAWTPIVFWRLLRVAGAHAPVENRCHSGDAPVENRCHIAISPVESRCASWWGWFAPKGLAAAAIVAAAQCFAGHVQIAALTALGTLVYLLAAADGGAARLRATMRWAMAWLLAGGLFAVQLLPTLLYLQDCTRTSRTYLDFCENSWLPFAAVGWILPMLLGQRTPNFFDQPYWAASHQVEQLAYFGLPTLLLMIAAFRNGWRSEPRRRGWWILAGFALLTALGMFGPVCPILYWLPGASVFRVPARAMLLVALAAAVIAAFVLDDMARPTTPRRARLRYFLLRLADSPVRTCALLIGVPLAGVLAVSPFLPEATRAAALAAISPTNPAVWLPLGLLLLTLAALGWAARRWDRPGRLIGLVAILAIDLATIGWTIDVPAGEKSLTDVLASPARNAWMEHVRGSTERLWVVTRREDRAPAEYIDPLGKASSNTNMLDFVGSLTDYGPLTPRSFASVFAFKPWGEPLEPDRMLAGSGWTQRCGVGWLLLCAADLMPPPRAQLRATVGNYRLYRVPDGRGRAYLDDAAATGLVRYEEFGPHRFRTVIDTWPTVMGEQRVVVARQYQRGWTATIDGLPMAIAPADGTLLSADFPARGRVVIDWTYEPPGLRAGAALSAVMGFIVLLVAWVGRVERVRRV